MCLFDGCWRCSHSLCELSSWYHVIFKIKNLKRYLYSSFGLNLVSPWGGCQELPLYFCRTHAWEKFSFLGLWLPPLNGIKLAGGTHFRSRLLTGTVSGCQLFPLEMERNWRECGKHEILPAFTEENVHPTSETGQWARHSQREGHTPFPSDCFY